jgi:hypothetical protein
MNIIKTILIAFILSILISCEKCGTCTQTIIISSYPKTQYSYVFEACGEQLDEINGKIINETSYVSGQRIITTTKTNCRFY